VETSPHSLSASSFLFVSTSSGSQACQHHNMKSSPLFVVACVSLLGASVRVRALQEFSSQKHTHGVQRQRSQKPTGPADINDDPMWKDAMLMYGEPDGPKEVFTHAKAETMAHQQEMHGMTQQQQKETIRSMQSFVANAPEGFATLVLFGDSTMSGILTELLGVSDPGAMEIIYVSNDRAKSVRYGCNEECGGVPPGGEWKNETLVSDKMTKLTVQRAEASTQALHASKCNSGGGLETYVFRTGPYKNLVVHHWGFLPEYAQYCWLPCMTEAMEALKPTAVVWNIGFHLLNHDFSPSVCEQRHNPANPGCGDYKLMVTQATSQMIQSGIQTVVWKHTNWVCEDRQVVGFPETKKGLATWNDESNRASLEKTCQKECPQYKGMSCYDWFFNAHTSERM